MSKLALAALVVIAATLVSPASGQKSTPTPAPLPVYEDKELRDAQIRREKAQADYYQEEANKLRAGTPVKSFWQSVYENPASALGVLGAFLTALFAAAVGLLNLFVNNRTATRTQRDTQFYEALKRFGDKDSPAVRSSAAAILAQMATHKTTEFNYKRPLTSIRDKAFPYFHTAWNQLVTGMLLDEEPVVLIRISEAVEEVIEAHPEVPVDLLQSANVKIQEDIRIALIDLFIALGVTDIEAVGEALWLRVSPLVSYWEEDLLKYMLFNRLQRTRSLFRSHLLDYQTIPAADKPSNTRATSRKLQLSGFRLLQNISVFGLALKHHSQKVSQVHNTPLFLAGAPLGGTDLLGADLKKVILTDANLRKANLQEAYLQGAVLTSAKITDAKLWGARVDEQTNFSNTKWWEADFCREHTDEEIDTKLLQELISRHGQGVPSDLNQMHASVRNFISEGHEGVGNVATDRTDA